MAFNYNIVSTVPVVAAINDVKTLVRGVVKQAEKWRDPRKPLGEMHAPGIPPTPGAPWEVGVITKAVPVVVNRIARAAVGHTLGRQGLKGAALRENAALAGVVQQELEALGPKLNTLAEPVRSINMSYLQHLADATVVAGRACQELCKGNHPENVDVAKLAAGWVVVLACSPEGLYPNSLHPFVAALDKRVKDAAIKAYPLFSAGKKLNEMNDDIQATNVAFHALDLL